MTKTFAVTWDYRCPFARNAHDHVVTALQGGADWDVRFVPFSLDQAHVEEGETAVWEQPERFRGLTVNCAGIVVRERFPEQFLAAHDALFGIRHDKGLDQRDPEVVAAALDDVGLDGATILKEVNAGWPLEILAREHTEVVKNLQVFGVPTFMIGDEAVFVRLMNRPLGDVDLATTTIERVLDLIEGWTELNEFKHTRVLR